MEHKPLSLECDNCGAKISAHTAHGTYTCEYCGHRIQVSPPSAAPPPTTPAQARSNRTAVIVLVVVLGMFLIGSVVTSLVTCGVMATFFKLAQ